MDDRRVPRYEEIANRLGELIASGAYKRGERLPSIRELSTSFHVSVNTCREAYALLERRRLARAVPQSGYFAEAADGVLSVNVPDPVSMDPDQIGLCRIYSAMHDSGFSEEDGCGLAIATLSPDLLQFERLQRYAVDAVRLRPLDSFHYQMAPGYAPLREQVAILGMASGTRTHPDSLIITSGCQESVYLALSAVTSPGDTVAVESPIYFSILGILESLRLKVLEIPCSPEEGMHLETLEFALDRYRVSAVFTIANFHNPTGSVMSDERKERLVRTLSRRGIPLIEDDIYGDLYYGPRCPSRPRTCKSFDEDGTVLYCSSFSKTLSPGLRVGWLEAGRWRERAERLKNLINLGAASIPQVTVALFLQDGGFERHLRRVRSALGAKVASLRSSVLAHFPAGTRVSDPSGGMVLWVELPDGILSRELYRRGLERKLMIAPGHVFGVQSRFDSSLRLNAGVWEPSTDAKIKVLGEMAREIRGA